MTIAHDHRTMRIAHGVLVALLVLALLFALLTLTARPAYGQAADSTSSALIARGDSIFHGRVGGALCATCHGPRGAGIPGLAPRLSDARWLHGDGGMDFLARIIGSGVAKPKENAGMMPPFGGTPLTPEQHRAVAAYVHSLRASATR
ncbi:MAG TPA: c-type cytochrome [Gemmatimonadaceae bacterium]